MKIIFVMDKVYGYMYLYDIFYNGSLVSFQICNIVYVMKK